MLSEIIPQYSLYLKRVAGSSCPFLGRYESLPIIFLTSSPEFAVESYRVRAFDYLLKPIDPVFLTKTLNRVYEHIVRSDPSSFIVNPDNVRSVNNRELVTISESPVPIARNLVHSTKEAFF